MPSLWIKYLVITGNEQVEFASRADAVGHARRLLESDREVIVLMRRMEHSTRFAREDISKLDRWMEGS